MNNDWDYDRFNQEFFKLTGLNLESYKNKQMERRINQLIIREGFKNLYDFFENLQTDKDLLHKFYNYLTINTSVFFRDARIYKYLHEKALPDLLANNSKINIWSIGCSRGEEPYSIAIMLDDLLSLKKSSIYASDIDDKALEMARVARYAANQIDKIPEKLRIKAFTENSGSYYLDDKYKEVVTFHKHNFLDSIYSKMPAMHLALCRNVFIYFKMDIQEWIIDQISRLLLPGGYFIIGCAEFINKPERFNLERKMPAIYQKLTG